MIMIDKEIWKLIDNKIVDLGMHHHKKVRRKYYVSNFGRCKINDKIVEFKPKKKTEIEGYYFFHGKRVHRWVAELFIPNPDNLPCVDHIDTNIHNNRVDNLRWVDYKGNANNPITLENMSKGQLKNGGNSERTKKQWEEKRDKMVQSIQKSQPKRTASLLKVMKTQSYHDNMSVTQKGRKWINNGIEQKKLFPEDIEPYLLNGWAYGMLSKSA